MAKERIITNDIRFKSGNIYLQNNDGRDPGWRRLPILWHESGDNEDGDNAVS